MKKNHKAIAAGLVVIICVVFGFSYFHVNGNKIAGVSSINDTCEVEIIRHDISDGATQQYILEAPQIEHLRQLLQKSSFTRRLHLFGATSHDPVFYSICIFYNDCQDFLSLDCLGGSYVLVSSTLDEHGSYELKINNKDWKSSLEKILQATKQSQ